MDRFNELKSKYQPAIDSMPQNGVQVNEVGMRDNKLFILGIAPSQDQKNAVWNQIKAIDSTYSDLICDIKLQSEVAGLHDASPQALAGGLSQAFGSGQTSNFPSMLSNLFGNSDNQQRAGLLNNLMASAGPSLLGAALPGPLASLFQGGAKVTPEQAANVSPEAIQQMAAHAQKTNPSIVEQASSFYSEHPKVIQALGAGALAMVMSHMRKD